MSDGKTPTRVDRFVDEYLVDGIGTQAAIRAGYSPKSAAAQASRLLSNANVRARIDKALAQQSRRTGITADRVLKELARVAFINPTDAVNIGDATLRDDATRDDTAAIASVRVKVIPGEDGDGTEREIRFGDKVRALELLGKHFEIFTDKHKVSGDKGEPIRVLFDVPRPGGASTADLPPDEPSVTTEEVSGPTTDAPDESRETDADG